MIRERLAKWILGVKIKPSETDMTRRINDLELSMLNQDTENALLRKNLKRMQTSLTRDTNREPEELGEVDMPDEVRMLASAAGINLEGLMRGDKTEIETLKNLVMPGAAKSQQKEEAVFL